MSDARIFTSHALSGSSVAATVMAIDQASAPLEHPAAQIRNVRFASADFGAQSGRKT